MIEFDICEGWCHELEVYLLVIVVASLDFQSLSLSNATMAPFLTRVIIILPCDCMFLCSSTTASIGRDKDKGCTLPTRYESVLLR